MTNQNSEKEQIVSPKDIQAFVAGFFPNTRYFDSRFDLLQVQIDELRRNQESFRDQLREFKTDVDRRFDRVDKRFEQVDKRFEQVDQRFQRLEDKIDALMERIDVKVDAGLREARNLTVKLFTFAISFSLVAVVAMFGRLFGLF